MGEGFGLDGRLLKRSSESLKKLGGYVDRKISLVNEQKGACENKQHSKRRADSEGADPHDSVPEPTGQVFGSNWVANCAEYYGSADSSGY